MTVRAELCGSYRCEAFGLSAIAYSPVLALCRLLIKAGHDPSEAMDVYRGEQLALRVRSIGEAAKLRVKTTTDGRLVFGVAENEGLEPRPCI